MYIAFDTDWTIVVGVLAVAVGVYSLVKWMILMHYYSKKIMREPKILKFDKVETKVLDLNEEINLKLSSLKIEKSSTSDNLKYFSLLFPILSSLVLNKSCEDDILEIFFQMI